MPVPGSEPEPGPVAPPALSLPPLRDLDKDLTGSETEDHHHHHHHHHLHHRQPRTQSSDPHLHQHFQRTESHRHYKALPQVPSSSFTPIYQHDRQSQYSSSAGSLPDMYANNPSAPSSTTTSTLSRADSVSTMEYLHTNHPHGKARDLASTNATHANTTTHAYSSSHESETLFQSTDDSKLAPPTGRNTKGSKNVISAKTEVPRAKAGSEGRNTTKRAAQNRAAQRAFRQRKDLYVRELERKAELLPVAESQVASLTARVEQLEALLAAAEAEAGIPPTVSSSLSSPQSDSPNGLVGAKSSRDRDWDYEIEGRDKASLQEGVMPDTFNRASSIRRIIPRHSSSHQLRQSYNSPPSPAPTNGSLKHSPHSYHHGGSDQELDTSSAHRHLRRNPSESSLNLRMREQSLSTSPRDASSYRSATLDTRMEITSPPPFDSQYSYGSARSSTLPVPSGRDHSSTRPYPSSPLTPSHERSPLYSIPQSHATGARPGLSTSPNSTFHNRHIEEGAASSFTSPDLNKKRPSEGITNWGGQDLYRSAEDGTAHSYHQVKKQSSWTSLSDQYRNQSSIRKQQSLGSLSDRRLLHQQHSPAIRDIQYYRDNSRGATSGGMTSGGTPLGAALSPISSTFNFSPKIHHSGSGSITLPPVSALSLASPSAGPRDLMDDDVAELSPIHAGERSFHNPYHHRPMLHHRASTNSLRATRNNQRRPSWPELSAVSPGSPGPSGSEGGNWIKLKESPEIPSSEGRFSSPAFPALAHVHPPYAQKPPLPSPMTYGSVSSSGGVTSEQEQGPPYPHPPSHAEHRPERAQVNGDTEMMHDAVSPLPTSPHRPHQRQGDSAMDLSDDPNDTQDESGTPMGSP